ncbi:G protein-coupled glucose receptor regulating Gpa2-domain-containing protein [Crucibulum laeve]|uniref:G protein-coupled glucose receptor regulating Gpa2-domain-containing protein n=1 Tax=Crucibulum laeve TaxID=68775 RepID=A0A5C3LKT8_9AGAR|nr:G protein-coupled glucose receptor regulating Gpa2-domain-containing protein [Crucibulum laeve]
MTSIHGLPIAIAGLNLAGSFLSLLGSGFIIFCYLILPMKHHFRHVLILNLAFADFLNALDLSVSGFSIVVRRRSLEAGTACVANGFICQLTVQGTDCAILAIAIVTVYIITRHKSPAPLKSNWDWSIILRVTLAIWILPITTSCIALGMNWYGPASGSWCWLVENPKYVRYVLTHGWRLIFIALEVGLYSYLYIYLRNHYRNFAKLIGSRRVSHDLIDTSNESEQSKAPNVIELNQSSPFTNQPPRPSSVKGTHALPNVNSIKWKSILSHRRIPVPSSTEYAQEARHISVQYALLLNAYPLAYIILVIPGIANRFMELTGHPSRVMQILQASTQFVGLANALTYGWNENISEQLRRKYHSNK